MAWQYLSQALGSALVALVAQINLDSASLEFFIFAGLMGIFGLAFFGITYSYQYIEDKTVIVAENSSQ